MSLDTHTDVPLPPAATVATPEEAAPAIDPAKATAVYVQLVQQQNFPLGVIAGFIAAVAGAVAWAAVTITTQYQIGWLAVGVGFLVGIAVRKAGRGLTKPFGIAGGILALFGCLLGNFLAMCGLVANEVAQPLVDVTLTFATQPMAAIELMKETFSPMDLLFYGIAAYEGYKFSFREIQDHELESMLS